MRGIFKLLRAQFRLHWVRMLLTAMALSVSVMLVVWTIGSYDSILNQSDHIAQECLGDFDLLVIGPGRQACPLDTKTVEKIQNDSQVELCFAVNSVNVSVQDRDRKGMRPVSTRLVGLIEGLQPFELVEGRLLEPGKNEMVLSQTVARDRQLKLGDEFLIEGPAGSFPFKLVGLARQAMSVFRSPGAYTQAAQVEQIAGRTQSPDTLYVKLQKGVVASKFAERYGLVKPDHDDKLVVNKKEPFGKPRKTGQSDELPSVLARDTLDEKLGRDRSVSAMKMQGYFAASVVTLAALFIVFTTLSMGVSERSRQLAILRAIGLTRRQVVWLILGESFLLAVLGWILGVGLGFLLLKGMAAWRADVFVNGIVVSPKCFVLTLVAAVVGAGAAGLLPALKATQLRPLDALAPRPLRPISFGRLLPISLVGLVLLCIAPWIVFMLDVPPDTRNRLYAYLGCPSGLVGFALLTPMVVLLSERIFVRPLGRVLGIERRLLQHQLSGNLWRSVGTCISLSTGLGLFVAVQTWGSSMLEPFLPGEGLPDAMVSIFPSGLDEKQAEELMKIDAIKGDACVPLVLEKAEFSKKTLDSPGFETVKNDSLLLMGFDASRAIGGNSPVVGMTFIKGSRKKAIEKLNQGKLGEVRYCIVPEQFTTQTKLSVGDRFELVVPEESGFFDFAKSSTVSKETESKDSDSKDVEAKEPETIQYEIAGVVSIPGWHWVTQLADTQHRSHRTLAAIFLDAKQARLDYDLKRTTHFWMNLKDDVTSESLEATIKPIAEKTAGTKITLPLFGEITAFRPFVKVLDTRELDQLIRRRAASVLWLLSIFPLLTLMVTSLAVINTVIMSVRVRRWEFGVLRSVGMTRSQQFRAVLGEALLIGLSACLLSFLFGLGAAWCTTGICRYIFVFGGLTPSIVVPWLKLSVGFGITLAICLAAALIPAVHTARKEPLFLLRAGRQSMQRLLVCTRIISLLLDEPYFFL